jgi:hypothetical protein
MPDYSNGKIYFLLCNDDYYYIGSTKNTLRYRLTDHKQASKKYPERRVYKHINTIGWENVKIQLIEDYSCNTYQELLKKENEYIASMRGDTNCLNINLAELTDSELKEQQKNYRQEHRDKILDYKKKYREENKQKIAEYNKKYEETHSEQVKEAVAKYREENNEKIAAQTKAYREAHKDDIKIWKEKYNETNKEKLKEKSKEIREKTKDKIKERGKKYYELNKDEINRKNKEYQKATLEERREQQKRYREECKIKKPQISQICEICNGSFTQHHKPRHLASKKHTDAILI